MIDILELFDALTDKLFPDEFMDTPKTQLDELLIGTKPGQFVPEELFLLLKKEEESVVELIENAILELPYKTHHALKKSDIDTRIALWYRIKFAKVAVGRRFHNAMIDSLHPDVDDVEASMIYVVSLFHTMALRPDQLDYMLGRYC